MGSTDLAVVGAGPIGTATAWRCARRGLSVVLIDPDPSRGAWRTAAGMLAPVAELSYAEAPLGENGEKSAQHEPIIKHEQRRRQPCELIRNSQQPRANRDECEHEHRDYRQESRSRYRQTDCENIDD